jgi:hypothetical protein
MKLPVALLPCVFWVAMAPAQEPAASPEPAAPVETAPALRIAEMTGEDRLQSLEAGQIATAIEALRQRHVESASLDETGLTRATLRGLLLGLAPGAELVGDTSPAVESPFRSELLDDRIGYIRVGSLRTEGLAQLEAALREFQGAEVQGIILDLRATPESRDFELAAQMASPFVPKNAVLFNLTKAAGGEQTFAASGEPVFRGVLAVLVDQDTAGAAEVLAGALRRQARAMVVGATTAGRAVEFEEVDLGDGQRLLFAAGEVRVPGLPAVYPDGLVPDLEVPQDAAQRDEIFAASLDGGMTSFVFEKSRAQMNEAALVAGTNPELARAETASLPLDRPLQSAVDLVTAIRLFRGLR